MTAGAQAADGPGNGNVDVGSCTAVDFCVGVGVDGSNGSQAPASTGGGEDSGGKPGKPDPDAPVCTVQKLAPPPPAGSALWEGHDPDDGAVYTRTCWTTEEFIGLNVNNTVTTFWAAAPPPAVDPAVLAQQAVDKMTLKGPDIASPRAAGKYVIGVPMWMWVNQAATTYGPNIASASAGGITVTATAKVTKIVWNMGDGSTVTCNGPGTLYTESKGMAESPTCGHTFSKTSADAGGKFKLTATSTWSIDWEVAGGGGGGQLTEVRQSQVQVAVGELQAVGS
ncbi:ATP/GTP-binding protein [Streptomyces sp. T21Q-yed]|uniref:ATP/GTP-binding protein n=1 Tax=Streptomyces sp. T21Q-yed TaxID=3018441 RepID=UPI0023DF7805|nr:ATP/GTP-binding protein [Streptomyces sp. T21Q-yed]MDF3141060.1 ATP/GTP-binding protein [Streptomyces sp. T21Q-yed]